MATFTRGQKSKLADLTPQTDLVVGVGVAGSGGETYDISCFGVDANGKLSDDRYFVFYNQTSAPDATLVALGARDGDQESFEVHLGRLPSTIHKLVFTVTLDGSGSMSSLRQGHLRVMAGGAEVARFPFSGSDFSAERAVIVAEIYKKDVWRFAAVGQGFNGGLNALLAHFGGEEAAPASAPPPPPPPTPPTPTPAGAPSRVSLTKITLEKKGDKQLVDLSKRGGSTQLHFNLNWNATGAPKKKGFLAGLGGGGGAPDLDLGCMFEMADGMMGVIQPLGGNFGDRNGPPYIHLDKDDRSGSAADGENLYIFRPDLIKRVMVFALIYEGAKDFTSVGGRLTIKDPDGNEILVNLNNPDANHSFCSICLVTPSGGGVSIQKEERYFGGHRDADQHYQFGFRWSAGSK